MRWPEIRVHDDSETSLKFAKMVEAAGAQLVAVHGRTIKTGRRTCARLGVHPGNKARARGAREEKAMNLTSGVMSE